jgi:hypothetical protein
LTERLAPELDVDPAVARESLVQNWSQINHEAGLGGLKSLGIGPERGRIHVRRTARRMHHRTGKLPRQALTKQQIAAAGTFAARMDKDEEFYVHGPEYWDLPTDPKWQDTVAPRLFTQPIVRRSPSSRLVRSTPNASAASGASARDDRAKSRVAAGWTAVDKASDSRVDADAGSSVRGGSRSDVRRVTSPAAVTTSGPSSAHVPANGDG